MKNFTALSVLVLGISMIFSASAGTLTDKNKVLEEIKTAAAEDLVDVEKVDVKVVTTGTEVDSKEESVGITDKPDTTEIVLQSTYHYLARFRNIFKRVMEIFGFRHSKKEGRTSRMLNDVDHTPVYQEEVRATVGAVLGQKGCIHKIACVSGSYLKGIKGKQLIFAFLESFSPDYMRETVKIAKRSANFNDKCDYKCLEE